MKLTPDLSRPKSIFRVQRLVSRTLRSRWWRFVFGVQVTSVLYCGLRVCECVRECVCVRCVVCVYVCMRRHKKKTKADKKRTKNRKREKWVMVYLNKKTEYSYVTVLNKEGGITLKRWLTYSKKILVRRCFVAAVAVAADVAAKTCLVFLCGNEIPPSRFALCVPTTLLCIETKNCTK